MIAGEPKIIRDLDVLLQNKLKGKIVKQRVDLLTSPGDNLIGLMLRVELTVQNEHEQEIIYVLAAKCFNPHMTFMADTQTTVFFQREIGWYSTVIPTVSSFMRDSKIPKNVDLFAKMFAARLSLDPTKNVVDEDGVILMENLKEQGYRCVNRQEGCDLETSKTILEGLATLHAATIAMKNQNPKLFEEKVKPFLNAESFDASLMGASYSRCLTVLEESPKCAPYVSKCQVLKNRARERKNEQREPWITATHGDLWINNIMVKKEKGKPTKFKLVDMQLTPYASLAEDVLFFVFTSVTTDLLKNNFDELFRHYHDELLANLKLFHVDTTLFSYENYEKELEIEAKGLHVFRSLCVYSLLYAPDDFQPTPLKEFGMDEISKYNVMEISERHKERMCVLVEECGQRNWL